MIGLEDRQALARDIHIAHVAGARLMLACEMAGIELRTLQRWKAIDGGIRPDGRPLAVRATPKHALSDAEHTQLLAVANEPRFAAVPPARIVPMLADEGFTWPANPLLAGCSRPTAKPPPWTRQGAQTTAATEHAHCHRTAPGVVLGHDLFTSQGARPMVSPLPHPRPV